MERRLKELLNDRFLVCIREEDNILNQYYVTNEAVLLSAAESYFSHGRNKVTENDCTIKRIQAANLVKNSSSINFFNQEMEVMQKIKHPYLIGLQQMMLYKGWYYIVVDKFPH